MKKLVVLAFLLGFLLVPIRAEAGIPRQHRIGDMGFHGGISETRHLPRTTETIILAGTARPATVTINMEYQEYIFLNFLPELFVGTMTVVNGSPANGSTAGTFNVTHSFAPHTPDTVPRINRTMPFRVYYHLEGNNMIYTYMINNAAWQDIIVTSEGTFELDNLRSHFVVSVIEDRRPGVHYYRGDIDARLFYTFDGDEVIEVRKSGQFHGYSSSWSATETHRINIDINRGDEAMQLQIRPSVSAFKTLQFIHNEPTIISFEGNFRELHISQAGLMYNIFNWPTRFFAEPTTGTLSMDTDNIFEQLPAPNMAHIRGHSAEDDIHRLFAMQVLQGSPSFFIPEQGITRGQFMTAVARALNLPVEEPPTARGRAREVHLFSDVSTERPEFRYIQAINAHGIAFGRADGSFAFDELISRQEAISTIVRALGLGRMAVDLSVISPFADSNDIASWAMKYTNIALGLGLIAPDANGYLHPTLAVSNAQAATLLNSTINFLREDIRIHYSDEIVFTVRPF